MTQHIGIVACSAEGAALCYRTICAEGAALLGAHAHPEVSMHTHSLSLYVECLQRNDWQGVGELMLASAAKLASAGAQFLICPDNTIHQALPLIRSRSPLPWLHIADVVVAEAARRNFRTLGVTGTRWLVDSEVYPEAITAHGLRYVRPGIAERDEANRIIMDELVYGIFKPAAVACFQGIIERLKRSGCDAVVLGCTEIPLIINDSNCALPTLDSTRLLARAALSRAVSGGSLQEPAMTRQLISSGSQFEHDIGYSRAVVDGDWVFVSGTTGFNYETMTISDSLLEQTEQCLKNIQTALHQAHARLADVVRVLYILPDGTQFPQCWPVLRRYLGEVRPAATMISAGLADPRMKIEIQVTARISHPA